MTAERCTPWFNTEDAADYLRTKPGTLKNWRHRGEGPRYHVVNGRMIRYRRDDLDDFVLGLTAPVRPGASE